MLPAVLLGASWTSLVLGAAWCHRPRRVRDLGPSPAPGPEGPLATVGRAIRSAAGLPPVRHLDAIVGRAAAAAIALLVIVPPLAPLPVLAALVAIRVGERRRERASAHAWSRALPDSVDLFALALGSGLTVPAALPLVGPRSPTPLGPALVEAESRFRHGQPLAEALARVADTGPATRPLVAILVASHCDGIPVAEPLARLASELRAEGRRIAESRARQTPVRLLFPLVLCTLPAFVLVTVVPPVITALSDISG